MKLSSESPPAGSEVSCSEPADGPEAEDGPEADPEEVAREIVLRKLAAQARSRSELATALNQRQVPTEVAERVLDRMTEVGLIDDTGLAESWVRSRQSRRHLSRRALKQELVRKGIEGDDIDAALDQVDDDDEYAAARALAEKKLPSLARFDRQVKYRRLAGALGRRGFSGAISSQVLSEVLDENDAQQ